MGTSGPVKAEPHTLAYHRDVAEPGVGGLAPLNPRISLPPEVVGDRVDAYRYRWGGIGVSGWPREGDGVRTFFEVAASNGAVIA